MYTQTHVTNTHTHIPRTLSMAASIALNRPMESRICMWYAQFAHVNTLVNAVSCMEHKDASRIYM